MRISRYASTTARRSSAPRTLSLGCFRKRDRGGRFGRACAAGSGPWKRVGPLCPIPRVNAGVAVRDDHADGTRHGRQARDPSRLGPWTLAPLSSGSASRNSQTRTLGEFHAVDLRPKPGHSVFRSRSGAGDEARTRDPYLGKVAFSFCIREGSKMSARRLLAHNFHRDPTLITRDATLALRASTLTTTSGNSPPTSQPVS
jgi:hypothetical protein